jgi:hypothetical protein
VQIARYYGASYLDTYAWQIHIPDIARFLGKIASVLERRLAKSPFATLTEEVRINFEREALTLHLRNGQITPVQSLSAAEGEIRLPRRAAVPLILGYRSRNQLSGCSPDVEEAPASGCGDETYPINLSPKEAHLIDVLFPKMMSHIYYIY